MMITFPQQPGAETKAAERSDLPADPTVMRPVPGYDVTCIEASLRVRDGLCPLCALPAAGLAVTCGDPDCVAFVGEMPADYVWVLQEIRALGAPAAAAPPDVPPDVDWRSAWPLVLAAGMTGGLFTLLAFGAGVWLDVLHIGA